MAKKSDYQVGISESGCYGLADGGWLDPPTLEGDIIRRNVNAEIIETRKRGDKGYEDWLKLVYPKGG